MRGLRFIPLVAGLTSLLPSQAVAEGETRLHEQGRCAIRGHCGKKSIFGGDLPCPDNGPAHEPEASERQKLVDLCGPKWEEGGVCCRDEQVSFRCVKLMRLHMLTP